MAQSKKGVSPEQLKKLCKELSLTVAAIAEETGLAKAYVSEFRSGARNLTAPQQSQLRAYLEGRCEAAGIDFPEDDAPDAASEQLVKGLGGMIQHINRPAILLSDDIPKAQAKQLLTLMESNDAKVSGILAGEFKTGGGLFGSEFSEETEEAIRQTFALLALNYLAILLLQGRSPVRRAPEAVEPKTMGDWLGGYLADSPLANLLPVAETVQKAPALAEGDDE